MTLGLILWVTLVCRGSRRVRGLCLFSAFRGRIGSRVRLAGRLRALGVFELAPG